jgi:hypothetical protein
LRAFFLPAFAIAVVRAYFAQSRTVPVVHVCFVPVRRTRPSAEHPQATEHLIHTVTEIPEKAHLFPKSSKEMKKKKNRDRTANVIVRHLFDEAF